MTMTMTIYYDDLLLLFGAIFLDTIYETISYL